MENKTIVEYTVRLGTVPRFISKEVFRKILMTYMALVVLWVCIEVIPSYNMQMQPIDIEFVPFRNLQGDDQFDNEYVKSRIK